MMEILERIYTNTYYPAFRDMMCRGSRYSELHRWLGRICPELSERQKPEVIKHLQLFEGRLAELGKAFWRGFTEPFRRALDYLKRKAHDVFVSKVEKEMPKFRQKAQEIEQIHNVHFTKEDAKEFIRRAQEGVPNVPSEVIKKVSPKTESYVDDNALSTTARPPKTPSPGPKTPR